MPPTRSGTDGTRTRDLEIHNLVVPAAFATDRNAPPQSTPSLTVHSNKFWTRRLPLYRCATAPHFLQAEPTGFEPATCSPFRIRREPHDSIEHSRKAGRRVLLERATLECTPESIRPFPFPPLLSRVRRRTEFSPDSLCTSVRRLRALCVHLFKSVRTRSHRPSGPHRAAPRRTRRSRRTPHRRTHRYSGCPLARRPE
jgi:hypothetical protein